MLDTSSYESTIGKVSTTFLILTSKPVLCQPAMPILIAPASTPSNMPPARRNLFIALLRAFPSGNRLRMRTYCISYLFRSKPDLLFQ